MTAPHPPSRGPAPMTVAMVAVVVATAIVVLGGALGTDRSGRAAPAPTTERQVPAPAPASTVDLASALPGDAEALAGEWAPGAGGATVAALTSDGAPPLLAIPLAGPPWATVTVTGPPTEGWSVAFGVSGAATYWAATLHPGAGTVELVRVRDGRPSTIVTRPVGGAVEGRVVVRWQGRQVQVEASGTALPTVSVPSPVAAEPGIGLLGRGGAGQPGAARWASVEVESRPPLGPALLPPLLGARHITADEARAGLGG